MTDKSIPVYLGYHDQHDLPVRQGQWVRIRKGTIIRSTQIGSPPFVAGRTYVVVVRSLDTGTAEFVHAGRVWPAQNPRVVWVGSGGYWFSADVNDVEVVT